VKVDWDGSALFSLGIGFESCFGRFVGFGSVRVLSSINFDVKVYPADILYKSINTRFHARRNYCPYGSSTIMCKRKVTPNPKRKIRPSQQKFDFQVIAL